MDALQRTWEKRRQRQDGPPKTTEKDVRRQLAWATGSEFFSHRDPLYHITEDFQQTFDEIGRRHAAALAGETLGGFSRTEETEQRPAGSRPGPQTGAQRDRQHPDPTNSKNLYQMRYPDNQDMIRRFSETAFQRGTLSAAVMGGTGKMMLVSCLRRTVGQSQPVREQQRRLFEGGSQQRVIPGHGPDNVVFNRGFADSAVGLVVDTLADARQMVESMADLAAGKSDMGSAGGAQTLRKMYPFLDDSRERSLLEQYGARLRESTDAGERHLLQNACVRAQAIISKKNQMRNEFISKLRFIADRATEALTLFETPGFIDELVEAVSQTDDTPVPPDDPAGDAPETPGAEEDGHAAD